MSTRSWWRSAEKKYQLKYKALSSFILKWDQLKPIVKKTLVVCTNNNTSTIVALFCPLLWFYVLFLNKQCRQRILQDFSSLPYDCEFADFFFCLFHTQKTTTTRKNSMLPSSVVRTKTGGTIRIRVCHKHWNDVLFYSLLNGLTAKWNIFVLYNKKERKTTNLPSTTWLFKDRHYPSYKRYVSSILLLFFFI